MQGHDVTSTTWVKGPRKRTQQGAMMGMGGDVATIEQCDLKQYVQVNDKKKLYHVEPMESDSGTTPTRPTGVKSQPVTKGGTVTYVNNITDTGERKQMYGMTARHLKTSMSIESSPDACTKSDMKMESDGWYIDLPSFSCPVNLRPMNYGPQARGGCQDKVVFRNSGGGKLGFPLEETRTMMFSGMTSVQTTSTVEFSRDPLEAALFDVPTSYTLVDDTSKLYGQPDMAEMMRAAQANNDDDRPSGNMGGMNNAASSFSGTKIAVLMPTNRGEGVSTSGLQSFLVQQLTGGNVMGIAVSSEAEARSMGATYRLSSDITKLKQSKAGGLFGAVTGINAAAKYDAEVNYKLIKLADGSTALSSKSSAKSETEAQAAAEGILGQEARAVLGVVK
jgi:hypothetical protein